MEEDPSSRWTWKNLILDPKARAISRVVNFASKLHETKYKTRGWGY